MLVKFLVHGTGSAQAAADYLTRELDSQGDVRGRRGGPARRSGRRGRGGRHAGVRAQVHVWSGSPGPRRTSQATRTSTGCSTSSSRPPGPDWPQIATPGRRCSTARPTAACTCMCSPRGATWRPVRASTSRRRAGSRPMGRSSRPATSTTAGAARTTRRAPGSSSRGTAPTSRRRSCGRGSRARTTRARRSGTTYCSASSTVRCRTERASSPPYKRRASTCRGRVTTTSPCETRPPKNGGG